jgi:hypothetical protein
MILSWLFDEVVKQLVRQKKNAALEGSKNSLLHNFNYTQHRLREDEELNALKIISNLIYQYKLLSLFVVLLFQLLVPLLGDDVIVPVVAPLSRD